MFFTYLFRFGVLFLPHIQCFFVEICLVDRNESKSITLICGPPAENMNMKRNHTVLWHGSQFGIDEQQKLAEMMQTNALVPNISINSSKRHRCYLLAAEDVYKNFLPQKKRVSREDSQASIPSENGICPPGYRIDQDRCFPCFPGSYTSGQDAVCFLCPKDFYMDKKAADACWPCPGGKKTLAQGADSIDDCVYFDELGHPLPPQSPPWIPIFVLVGVIIACIWIIIIVLFIRYWNKLHRDDSDQPEEFESRRRSRFSKPLLNGSESGSHIYESASDYNESDEHIYAEIGDYGEDDEYEVPIKPSDKPIYVDITANSRKWSQEMAKPRKSTLEGKKENTASHLYELPDEKSSEDHMYEVPIPKRSESHSYEVPIQRVLNSEVILKRNESEANNFYNDVAYKSVENETENLFSKTSSKGFNPESFSTGAVRDKSFESQKQSRRKARSSQVLQLDKSISGQEMIHMPNGKNMYDASPKEAHSDEIYD